MADYWAKYIPGHLIKKITEIPNKVKIRAKTETQVGLEFRKQENEYVKEHFIINKIFN